MTERFTDDHRCLVFFRDCIIISLSNCATSIFSGFVVFSYLGFLSGQLETSVDKVANSGNRSLYSLRKHIGLLDEKKKRHSNNREFFSGVKNRVSFEFQQI